MAEYSQFSILYSIRMESRLAKGNHLSWNVVTFCVSFVFMRGFLPTCYKPCESRQKQGESKGACLSSICPKTCQSRAELNFRLPIACRFPIHSHRRRVWLLPRGSQIWQLLKGIPCTILLFHPRPNQDLRQKESRSVSQTRLPTSYPHAQIGNYYPHKLPQSFRTF